MATSFDPDDPGPAFDRFMAARHLATLTVLRPDGSPQVTPVGFTYDPSRRLGRVITWADSYKAKHAGSGGHVAICHVDGGQWLTFYGTATVSNEPDEVAEAVERYANRYRQPKERDDRVVIVVEVDRIIGRLAD
ncbi:MAG: TIGR03618 family F420-dependent PPOX class oxidoreductase [Acidimicrobiales bacterium]